MIETIIQIINIFLGLENNIDNKNIETNTTEINYNLSQEKEENTIIPEEIEIPPVEPAIEHIKTPDFVKSLYYTAYSASNEAKLNSLINLVKTTEINSVTIDIKEVDWYVSFDLSEFEFDRIKPATNNKITNIKELIKRLHEENIYVIWRIVVFKDNLLSTNRPDLAIKKSNKVDVWADYKWNKFLDAFSKEVWDYNKNIAAASYQLWFDEINFDYVRFPSDWAISDTYYSFSNEILSKNPRWWKIIVLDKFSNYITSNLKNKFPEIILSADIFWLVTKSDLFNIWQNLESFLLYFDYVWPMTYPSHYWKGYLGFEVPDNYPYEIIKENLSYTNSRIDKLNNDIKNVTSAWTALKIKNAFIPEANIYEIWEIPKTKVRPWIQGFSCTRCKGATPYSRYKFRKQIEAIEDSGLNSWWVWNSASNYYINWYNK